ncbi:MAG TPA: hypothetical protein VIV40_13040 [Kofleriaceae bacterium]
MPGFDAILERQARQLKTLGIALVAFAALSAASAIYLVAADATFINQFYGFSGAFVFGSSGIAAIVRSRKVERELAEQRRTGGLPTAIVRERK